MLFPYWQLIVFPILLIAAIFLILYRRPSRIYEHAVARIEAGGVKRGLTPPEAAALLGYPFNTILALVIFGLLRKGILRQDSHSPLSVSVAAKFQTKDQSLNAERRAALRKRAAQSVPTVIYTYEEIFLELLEQNDGSPVAGIDYSIFVSPFLKLVTERIAGYDLEETREYYRLIIERGPKEARVDGALVLDRKKVFDRNLLWLMLHKNFQVILDSEKFDYIPSWQRTDVQLHSWEEQNITFASWALIVIHELKAAIPENALEIKFGKEIDSVTAQLLADISRATFYG